MKITMVGGGWYKNRGCQAIVYGTNDLLKETFNNLDLELFSIYNRPSDLLEQISLENERITNHSILFCKQNLRGRIPIIFASTIARRVPPNSTVNKISKYWLSSLEDSINTSDVSLSIGGDLYSTDYGFPHTIRWIDEFVVNNSNTPHILWGASIGPFNSREKQILNHINRFNKIIVRESISEKYLKQLFLTDKVKKIYDPAFYMIPKIKKSKTLKISKNVKKIGINISPIMMNKIVSNGIQWNKYFNKMIATVLNNYDEIFLIPHVLTNDNGDDLTLMKNSVKNIENNEKEKIIVVNEIMDARETKWLISNMDAFIGARTHSTIAAISTGVPTLTIAYSRKGWGINEDVFGTSDYCMSPECGYKQLDEKIDIISRNKKDIKNHLDKTMIDVKKNLKMFTQTLFTPWESR